MIMNRLWLKDKDKTPWETTESGPKSKFFHFIRVFYRFIRVFYRFIRLFYLCFWSVFIVFCVCLFILVLLILSSARSTDYWVNMGEFNEMGWAGAGTYQPSWPLKKMDMLSLPFVVHVLSWSHIVIVHWLINPFNAHFPFHFFPLLSCWNFYGNKETSAVPFLFQYGSTFFMRQVCVSQSIKHGARVETSSVNIFQQF